MLHLDLVSIHAIQSFQPYWLTMLMRLVSWLLAPEFCVPILVGILLVLFLRHKRAMDSVMIALLAGNVVPLVLKPVFHVIRPSSVQAVILDAQSSYSMPSGHAVASITIAACIYLFLQRRGRVSRITIAALVCGVVLVGYSRVYLGAHWPSDVVTGWGIGVVWVLCIWHGIRPHLIRDIKKNTS